MANSKIYLGNTNIGSLFKGASDISIYLGENKVYPLAEPTFKWKATYSDSSVTSAECDSSSAITNNEITKSKLVTVEIGDCVTTLGVSAFTNCTGLTTVTIPNNVTDIQSGAFRDCKKLESIVIPNGVTRINTNTFKNCSGLTSVTIPSGVTIIDESAFNNCNHLTSIDIPSGVTIIGGNSSVSKSGAFYGCSGLTSIDIPDSVTDINAYAFQECRSLTSCTIGSGVTFIGNQAFVQCTGLTSITVEATTPPTLGIRAFDGSTCPIYVPCESVEAYKTASRWSGYANRIQAIPNSCPKFYAKYSGGETYRLECDGNTTLATGNTKPSGYQTSAMTEAIIGDCVTEIGEHAFYGYSGLTSVSISDSVTTIGIAPFQNCYSLTSVTIPSGVTFIGNQAFVQCTGLTSVTCLATTPPSLSQRVFNTGNSCPIYVPSASLTAYQTAWSDYASRIQAIP